jgi:hypothetical protein
MTTLAELRTKVARDIRDPNFATFTTTQVDDFINGGMMEVSRVYPKEVVDDITPVADTYAYDTTARTPFRVELYDQNGAFLAHIPMNGDESSQGGWEWFAEQVRLPQGHVNEAVGSSYFWRVWGYGERAQLTADGQVADLDVDGEWGVRTYSRWMAYQTMAAERALFKQWQAQSQNTDITQSQMQAMVLTYSQEWDRARNHLRRLRRV